MLKLIYTALAVVAVFALAGCPRQDPAVREPEVEEYEAPEIEEVDPPEIEEYEAPDIEEYEWPDE